MRNLIPREKIPWFPRIDEELCAGCMSCIEFCHNGVYLWDEENRHPIVAQPYNCVVGCSACSNLCPNGAISFPSKKEIVELLRKLREEVEENA